MLGTLRTLVTGANARAEQTVRDAFSIELIDQKIREAEQRLKSAKLTLAGLIQRHRAETAQMERLTNRLTDLNGQARQALDGGRDDLAQAAASAIAALENEQVVRQQACDRLDTRVMQLRSSVEAGQRRIIDLKQGAIAARAARREQEMQRHLNRPVSGDGAFEEAEALIARVLDRDDPFERNEILADLEADLDHSRVEDRLSDAGFGKSKRSTQADVLARLKSTK